MMQGKHVAIIGLGPSANQFLELAKRAGGRRAVCDEVWGINGIGDVYAVDRVFHMDDVRIQEIRAKARPESNIARMLEWMRSSKVSIVTSRAHPDYPALEEFPLEAVVNDLGFAYFNSTAAYAVAYAIHMGVAKLSCYGMDFTYPNAHDAEKGRACVEFWLGIAAGRGIRLAMPRVTSLMDACYPVLNDRLYGYDTLTVTMQKGTDGNVLFGFEYRDKLPSAEEIEARYDHSRHPSPLVAEAPPEQ